MIDVHQNTTQPRVNPVIATQAFVMLKAEIREPELDETGHYDPATQTWIGGRKLGLASGSTRRNPSGVFAYQTDD